MKLVYHGPLYDGSTSLQRARALAKVPGVTVIDVDTGARQGQRSSLYSRIRNKFGLPVDRLKENENLLLAVENHMPDVAVIDNSKVIKTKTIDGMRLRGVRQIIYYTPDDVLSRHNISKYFRDSITHWDAIYTTKSFHEQEMNALGARKVCIAGNSFDPEMHRPFSREEVGEEFEAFDCVFIGANEPERRASINFLARQGFSVVVYGSGRWDASTLDENVTLRAAQFGISYSRCLHHGKIALGFLRKISRDRITTRSIEIAAAGRPMVAEKTDEHDAHFLDGVEYAGFLNDAELAETIRRLLKDPDARRALAASGRRRCLASGYSVIDRAETMVAELRTTMKTIENSKARL